MKISGTTLFAVLQLSSGASTSAFQPNANVRVRVRVRVRERVLVQAFKGAANANANAIQKTKMYSATENQNQSLPDVDKTSIDIDQHKLEKKNKWRRPELFGKSIIDQTMEDIDQDEEFQKRAKTDLKDLTREERLKRRRALDSLGIPSFNMFLSQKNILKTNTNTNTSTDENTNNENIKHVDNDDDNTTTTRTSTGAQETSTIEPTILNRKDPEVLQINVGLYCNQACQHCHVDSSPLRKETMSQEIAAQCIALLKNTPTIHTLDITGGAPELNESFRYIVAMAREIRPDLDIIDRCNLTVLQEPGQEDLVDFLIDHKVHVIASLPCYSAENVNKQRGSGVFDRSISALLAFNEKGYGKQGSGLVLDLVYNPLGAFLPPSQEALEGKYKEELAENFGIEFNSLYTMTNIPVKRFTDFLYNRGELKDYMDLLVRNFNPDTLDNLMCGNTVSVGFDGRVFDCDFNQQLGYTIGASDYDTNENDGGKTVFDIESLADLKCDPIKNDSHCFGCTAGNGSS